MQSHWRPLAIRLCLAAGLLAAPPHAAVAAGNTYVVTGTADTSPVPACTGGPVTFSCPTLRAAVLAANAAAGADTIQLSHGAVYTLAIPPGGANDAATGDLNLTDEVTLGLPAVICFPVCGAVVQGAATADAALDRVFYIASNVPVTMRQITIRHGNTQSAGGGVLNAGLLAMTDSSVMLNLAGAGGGIYSNGGVTALDNVRVLSNSTGAAGDGGGLYHYAGELTLNNSLVQGNQARSGGGLFNNDRVSLSHSSVLSNTTFGAGTSNGGGGIWNNGGDLTLLHTTLRGNAADNGGSGGGLYNTGVATITFSAITLNAVYGPGFGAGIANYTGALSLLASTLISNTAAAGYGGGLLNNYSALAIIDLSTVAGNVAGANGGGGLYNNGVISMTNSTLAHNIGAGGGGAFNNGALSLQHSAILSNTSTLSGGAIHNVNDLTLAHSTVSGNRAYLDGGGLASSIPSGGAAAVLDYVTIANNLADADQNGTGDGGGLRAFTPISITNTLVAGNLDPGGQAPDCQGTLASLGYNLLQTAAGCALAGVATGNIIGVAPLLGPLQDNGGATWTHTVSVVSSAVDAADPAHCPSQDQRHFARPAGPRCDIGAYEYIGPPAQKAFLPLLLR